MTTRDFWSGSFSCFSGGVQTQGRMRRRGVAFPILSCKTRTFPGPWQSSTYSFIDQNYVIVSCGHLCLRGSLGKQPVLPCVGYEFLLFVKGILLARKGQGKNVEVLARWWEKIYTWFSGFFKPRNVLHLTFFRIALATLTLGFTGSLCILDLRKMSF